MAQLEITGRRPRLDDVLLALQFTGRAEPAAPHATRRADLPDAADRERLVEELTGLNAEISRLLDEAEPPPSREPADAPAGEGLLSPVEVQAAVVAARTAVGDRLRRLEALQEERDSLPPVVEGLSALMPLVPELASLTDAELAEIHLATIVLVLDDPQSGIVRELRTQLNELLGHTHLLVTTADAAAGPDGSRPATAGATGCLLVLPARSVAQVENLLGRDHVARMSLPPQFTGMSLRSTVRAMQDRLRELPGETERVRGEAAAALVPYVPGLIAARASVRARRERVRAVAAAEFSERAFAFRVWVPVKAEDDVTAAVRTADPSAVVDRISPRRWRGTPPTLLRNVRLARPFERFVSFLSWPAPGGLDPTGLMAAVLPALFGIMVGDIGYGLVLAGAGYLVRRRWGARVPALGDIGRVLMVGGAWATFFGALFGELLGDLGKAWWGLPALWFYRGGSGALIPLLTFVLAVGATHLVLGLLLGVWLAARERHLPHLLERVGTLLVLGGVFALAGVAIVSLPGGTVPPALAAIVVGLAIAGWAHGPLGVLLGPLEVIGRVGNMLSYLRLAAVGLASVYLAIVANELARQAPLLLGIVVAAFFHALNLALAAFSPMIQALRLHYVEFFGTFHDGTGRPFTPLGADLAGLPLPTRTSQPAAPEPERRPVPV